MKAEMRPDNDRKRYSKASEKKIMSCPTSALKKLAAIERRSLSAITAKKKKLLEEQKKKRKI